MSETTWGGFARLDVDGNHLCFTEARDKSVIKLTDGSIKSICGKLDHYEANVDEGIVIPRMSLKMQPTPEELDIIFPWIGFEEAPTDTFTPTIDITTMPLPVIFDRVASIDGLGNAYVNTAIFRGQKGTSPMSLELDLIFDQIIDLDGEAWVGVMPENKTAPYPFHRSTINLESAARSFRSFAFAINNNLIFEHENNRVPTNFQFGDEGRTYHLGVDTPYLASNLDLLSNPIDSVAGDSAALQFTRDTQSTLFSFTNLKLEASPPDVMKSEVRLSNYYKAYGSGSTLPVIITHDATA